MNIVAHSKGGYWMQGSIWIKVILTNVANLIMIGTNPNGGAPVEDELISIEQCNPGGDDLLTGSKDYCRLKRIHTLITIPLQETGHLPLHFQSQIMCGIIRMKVGTCLITIIFKGKYPTDLSTKGCIPSSSRIL